MVFIDAREATGHWKLSDYGVLPRIKTPSPPILKIALVLGFRFRIFAPHLIHEEVNSLAALVAPHVLLYVLWLPFVVTAVISENKNPTAAACLLGFGTIMFTLNIIAMMLALIFYADIALFLSSIIAAHTAHVLAVAHPDAVHGTQNLKYTMTIMTYILLILNTSWPLSFSRIPDFYYFIGIWIPDTINCLLHIFLTPFASALLQTTTAWKMA